MLLLLPFRQLGHSLISRVSTGEGLSGPQSVTHKPCVLNAAVAPSTNLV